MKHLLLMFKVLFWTSFLFSMLFLVMFFIHRDMQTLQEFVVTFIIWFMFLSAIVFIERTAK